MSVNSTSCWTNGASGCASSHAARTCPRIVACAATGVGPGTRRAALPDLFAHSVVPIIVGYMVAHYLTYLVEYGQQTIIQLSDPFSTGADYLGTGDRAVNYWLTLHPTFLATTKVAGVVLGSIYALGAIGVTLIFGILRFAHFAHAEAVFLHECAGSCTARLRRGSCRPHAFM